MSVLGPGLVLTLPISAFPPLALGFFGLGTGYLIYGGEELIGYPKRAEQVDVATGIWGIWMPGFMQFLAGTYLFLGLTLFHTFVSPPLYMAALAFTAYGVHWFSLGMIRRHQADARANIGMTVAFLLISILGIIVFFKAGDNPVGGVFIGLTCVYFAEFFATLGPDYPRLSQPGERLLGFFHLGTGFWLIYLTFAVALNFSVGFSLPT
jgi:hypothetical protein